MGPIASDGEVGLSAGAPGSAPIDVDGSPLLVGRGPRVQFQDVRFATPVRDATVCLTGLTFQYGPSYWAGLPMEDNLGRHDVHLSVVAIEGNVVRVRCMCALRDWSVGVAGTAGDYDQEFQMQISFMVLADLEASGVPVPLVITGIEHNQCTQHFRSELRNPSTSLYPAPPPIPPDNSIPLVDGKDTVLRVYVATGDDPSAPRPAAISGVLHVRQVDGPWHEIPALNRMVLPALDRDVDRENPNHTLNFAIPGALCHGHLQYRVRAFEDAIIPRGITSTPVQRTLNFRTTKTLNIFAVRIRYTGPGGPIDRPSMIEVTEALSGVAALLPTANVTFTGFADIDFDGDFTVAVSPGDMTSGHHCGPTWARLLSELLPYCAAPEHVVFGFVPAAIPRSAVAGCENVLGLRVAAITTTDPFVAIHELLHVLCNERPAPSVGADHDPCPGSTGDTNRGYVPYQTSSGPLQDGSIGEPGIDRFGMLKPVRGPSPTFTILSACGPKWIDPRRYTALLEGSFFRDNRALRPEEHHLLDAEIPYERLFLELAFERGHKVSARPSFHCVAPGLPDVGIKTPYSVEIRDKAGLLLFVKRILKAPTDENWQDSPWTPLMVDMPFQKDAAVVTVVRDASDGKFHDLLTLPVADHAPTIALDPLPKIGAHATTLKLSWTASADDLRFRVRFSSDAGKTWRNISGTLTKPWFDVNLEYLAGGDDCALQVLVTSAALRTGSSMTPRFALPKRPRHIEVAASQKAPGGPGLFTTLIAHTFSASFGSAAPSEIEWSSDRDGRLGYGQTLVVRNLSAGGHRIVAKAPDGKGGHCEASLKLVIADRTTKEHSSKGTIEHA